MSVVGGCVAGMLSAQPMPAGGEGKRDFLAWPGPPVINPPGRNFGTPNLVVQPF